MVCPVTAAQNSSAVGWAMISGRLRVICSIVSPLDLRSDHVFDGFDFRQFRHFLHRPFSLIFDLAVVLLLSSFPFTKTDLFVYIRVILL